MNYNISFNHAPQFEELQIKLLNQVFENNHLSGNGPFTKKCHDFFKSKFGYNNPLLTTSCTAALEMVSILIDIQPGDEVILPAYTFVSTANAFALRGAKVVFADSQNMHPNIDLSKVIKLITNKTKAIVVVHYGGVPCDMDAAVRICKENNLFLIEDAAQAIGSTYKQKPIGTFGDFSTFSFHESKNISCGEGGLLCVNNEEFIESSKIVWEKGTNREAFFEGNVNKYEWLTLGSSFTPSEFNAAILYSQLLNYQLIQKKRNDLYDVYSHELTLEVVDLGYDYSSNNHIVFLKVDERERIIKFMHENSIQVLSHYLSLNKSPYALRKNININCTNSEIFELQLLRLPIHFLLSKIDIKNICNTIKKATQLGSF